MVAARKIEPLMIQYIDGKLFGNGSADDAILRKDARAVFAFAMESLVGIREHGGNNRGPLVELIQETVGGHSGEAWCMSTIQTCLSYAEVKTGVISRLKATESCLDLWRSSTVKMKVASRPLRGAIAIYQYGSTSKGHTGMFAEEMPGNKNLMQCVEGNTTHGMAASGDIIRDGGGVYVTVRSMIPQGSPRLLGFLKPF